MNERLGQEASFQKQNPLRSEYKHPRRIAIYKLISNDKQSENIK